MKIRRMDVFRKNQKLEGKSMNKRKIGAFYEEQAAQYLEGKGYCILEKNFRCRQGEIDLIARDGDTLVFVEVKYRMNDVCGEPEEAVDFRKQKKIRRVAEYYLLCSGLPQDINCRFDVAALDGSGEIRYYENAFGGI